jgi:hypothetical protein
MCDHLGFGMLAFDTMAAEGHMRAFQVYLNGKRLCTAGVGDDGVLTAIVTWVRGARNTPSHRSKLVQGEDIFIEVGGLISPRREHVSWLQRSLRLGDDVRITVVERTSVDRPSSPWLKDSF